jgi:hypothetical protein
MSRACVSLPVLYVYILGYSDYDIFKKMNGDHDDTGVQNES